VKVLKDAAKTRKVAAEEILSALSIIEKAKVDPSAFFETLGGKESPGRTWMLIFTAEVNIYFGSSSFGYISVSCLFMVVGCLSTQQFLLLLILETTKRWSIFSSHSCSEV